MLIAARSPPTSTGRVTSQHRQPMAIKRGRASSDFVRVIADSTDRVPMTTNYVLTPLCFVRLKAFILDVSPMMRAENTITPVPVTIVESKFITSKSARAAHDGAATLA